MSLFTLMARLYSCRFLGVHKWAPIVESDQIRAEIWCARVNRRPVRMTRCARCGLKR